MHKKQEKVYFSGFLGKLDFDTLLEMVPEDKRGHVSLKDKYEQKTECEYEHVQADEKTRNRQVMFPGVTIGYQDMQAAK